MDGGPPTARAATADARRSVMEAINRTLPKGWEVKMMASGRLYYLDHSNARSQWLPPVECWPLKTHLPYGWEAAITDHSMQYYINHQRCVTTSCHPYLLQSEEPAPTRRLVTLNRDSINGFGFIAGSECPVVVRSVTEGGPSADKLLPGDHILEIAGEDVTQSKRMYIIDKIMNATDAVQMLVTQPDIQKRDGIRSSFLSHNKKQRLLARPLRVRFADNIKTFSPSPHKVPASLSYLPNILKVYLENGQTKSFRYDGNTAVKNVLESISTKLGIESPHHFALVTEDVRLSAGQKFHILSEDMTLRQVSSQPESQYWRCLYRLTFPPRDAYELLLHDNAAFDYFYQQCRNDVICERFGSDLKFDLALRLASLSVQQHFMKINKKSVKVSARMLQKQDGLELFLPRTLLETFKGKELRKQICLHLKQNQTFTPPGQKCLSEVQAKLHYLKIIAELPSYSCRTYTSMTLMNPGEGISRAERPLMVSPTQGICQNPGEGISKTELPLTVKPSLGICRVHGQENVAITALDQLERIVLSQQPHSEACEEDAICQIEIVCTKEQKHQFVTSHREGVDFVNFVCGLYKVYVDKEKTLLEVDNSQFLQDPNSDIPKYSERHVVEPAGWNYPDPDEHPGLESEIDFENIIDLSSVPPVYMDHSEESVGDEALVEVGSRESDISRGEESDEEETDAETDSSSVASLSDTHLSMSSEADPEHRRSVISLNDMSFDIQESTDGPTSTTEGGEEKISPLLVILNEESKEMLDGTAKLRMRNPWKDVVERKTSVDSSDCSSLSSFSLSIPDHRHSLVSLESPMEEPTSSLSHLEDVDESGMEPTGSSAQGYAGGDEGENVEDEDDEDIPVSLIDMPSPDPVTPSDDSHHFDYQTAQMSSEDNPGRGATLGDSPEGSSEIDQSHHQERDSEMGASSDRETHETGEDHHKDDSPVPMSDSVSSDTVNESLESIAASFQSTDDRDGGQVRDVSKRQGLENQKERVKEESLDDLVESFRVDKQDSDVVSYQVANCGESVSNSKQDSKEESLQGLVDALIEVAQVVDHSKYSKPASAGDGAPPTNVDQNGNFESVLQSEEHVESGMTVVEVEDCLNSQRIENVGEKDSDASQNGSCSSSDRNVEEGRVAPSVDVVSGEGLERTEDGCDAHCKQDRDVVLTDSADYKTAETLAKHDMESHSDQNISSVIVGDQSSLEDASSIILQKTFEHEKDDESPSHASRSDHERKTNLDQADIGHSPADATRTQRPTTPTRRWRDQSGVKPQSLDEAHGIQMAALLALDASLEDKGPEHPRMPLVRDEEGSDSGNETISSECVEGPSAEEPPSRELNLLPVTDDDVASVATLPTPPEYLETFPPPAGVEFSARGVDDVDSSYDEQEVAIDNETLETMRTVLCSSSLSELPEVTYTVGGSEVVSMSDRVNAESKGSSTNSLDSFIASMAVLPPPGLNDSFSADLLPVIPPPCLDSLYEHGEPDTAASNSVSGSENQGESATEMPGRTQREDGVLPPVQTVTAPEVSQPRAETSVDSKDDDNRGEQRTIEGVVNGGFLATPTPPPRRRNSRKGFTPRGSPKSASCKEKETEKVVLRRSLTYSPGDMEQPPMEAKKPSASDKHQPPPGSPASTPRQKAIGGSLSKVFSPVMSWSSFKESFRLPSSKPRTRMSLKSLWPETSPSCFEDGITSRSMENIPDGLKEDQSSDGVLTKVRLREKCSNATLRRCKSLGGDLQSVTVTPESFMADEVTDGTVVFPAEFWRKARQSAPPSPGRAAPPRPNCPPLSSLEERGFVVSKPSTAGVGENTELVDDGSDSDSSSVAPPLPSTGPPTSSVRFKLAKASEDGNVSGREESAQQRPDIKVIVRGEGESGGGCGVDEGQETASKEILHKLEQKEYSGTEGVTDAYMDIQILCHTLEVTQAGVARPEVTPERFNRLKERLMWEVREFTGSSKALVTSLNHSAARLALSMNHCMHTLTKLVGQGQQIVWSLHSELIASRLKHKICDLADHFTTLLQLVVEARGKANNSNVVQDVLRQAQTMAVLLSSLMRSVRMMQNYKQLGDKIVI